MVASKAVKETSDGSRRRDSKKQILPACTVVETAQLPPETNVRAADARHSQRHKELNLSSNQLLVGFTSAFGAVGLLLWAIVKLWLFE